MVVYSYGQTEAFELFGGEDGDFADAMADHAQFRRQLRYIVMALYSYGRPRAVPQAAPLYSHGPI